MTNLEIIKYLATNSPTRLAEFLEDIYCCAWNDGANDKFGDESTILSFEKWLYEDGANSGMYYDHELEEWSKAIDSTPTITAFYDNLSVTIPIKESADHMWNNNNEYDYKAVKDEQWIIPANHIVCGTVEGHQIKNTDTFLGDCGVIRMSSDTKCPHCGESFYTEEYSTSTAVYYPPIWKDGVNINPDRNKSTTHCRCLRCNKEFDI